MILAREYEIREHKHPTEGADRINRIYRILRESNPVTSVNPVEMESM